jgi:hypothetical protein
MSLALPNLIDSGERLPVCLVGERLTFLSKCYLRCEYAGTIIVNEGDSWDGASIPRWAWSVIGHPLRDEFRWASFWHDHLCQRAKNIECRTVADAVFLALLRDEGVNKWRRLAMWSAVRVYGIWVWRIRCGK